MSTAQVLSYYQSVIVFLYEEQQHQRPSLKDIVGQDDDKDDKQLNDEDRIEYYPKDTLLSLSRPSCLMILSSSQRIFQ